MPGFKKLVTLLLVIITVQNAEAQNAKAIAAQLLQHYTELAEGSYVQFNNLQSTFKDSIGRYDVPNIIDANKTQFSNYAEELKYTITFFRNNPLSVKTGKEIIKALKILGDRDGFSFVSISDDTYTLYKGAEEIMEYAHEQYVDIYPNEYLHLYIYANPPFPHFMADEKSYNGHYPTNIAITKKPQVVQLADGISSHAIIMNGIFEWGKLTQGSITLSGFDDFRNGTWLSRNWGYDFARAAFVPHGTTDTILGYVKNLNFLNFEPDNSMYYGYNKKDLKVLKSTIPWLKNVYEQRGTNRPNNQDHIYANATTLAAITFKIEARQHNTGLPDAAVKILDDGSTYTGGFANNQPEGEGTFIAKNGDTFKGKWHQGMPVGEFNVHYVAANNFPASSYVGGVNNKNLQWEGQGVLTFPDVTVSGYFYNGKLNGKGSKTFIKGGQTESGTYKDGLANGVMEYSDAEITATYTFVNGVKNGPAKIHSKATGKDTQGNYVNGEKEGNW